ncbi:NAD(P)/FAD-dependent oxidoreductase [Campylobacter geochelonis]|uniref:NAD(P)/FAD-dependent oxidoreductase n=1 Tax=Campylobacter geochelonis TaxID=1780362 RepID=UPI000770A085|nr:aminoacetone oxidase family FAD-binding enzyme [Campylobacter geochelonis]CZE48946.1 pyridine nucleotide-disulphide oxidoreductase [Campylobacter geochelonis]
MSNPNAKTYKILIIGGGASGLFLAANLDKNLQNSTAILEKNAQFGKKILASGGGRCNITNRHISFKNYLGDVEFIKQSVSKLKFSDVLNFFSELKFSEQKDSQFFCADSSKAVLNSLLKKLKECDLYPNSEVLEVQKDKDEFIITTQNAKFKAQNLIIASGGLSYKALGSSDIGYKIAQQFCLNVQKPLPALVGFTVQKDEFWFKHLSGVSLPVCLKFNEFEFNQDALFTHKGISGPAILNASLFWQKGQITINFVPNFSIKKLENSKKQLSTLLPLPKRFTKEFLSSQNLLDKPYDSYNQVEKAKVLKLFSYSFAPAGNFGFERAEITKGGVKTDEILPNFQSKKEKGLFFIGEILDVSGMLGGYNLHFAFASAKILSEFLNAKFSKTSAF